MTQSELEHIAILYKQIYCLIMDGVVLTFDYDYYIDKQENITLGIIHFLSIGSDYAELMDTVNKCL